MAAAAVAPPYTANIVARVMADPVAAMTTLLVLTVTLGQVVRDRGTQASIVTIAAAGCMLWMICAKVQAQTASAEDQVGALTAAIARMDASGYVKNNEAIPLRDRRRFRYVYLDARMVHLLNRLMNGFAQSYRDAVYSTLFYCEAFMRQYYRVLNGKVREPSSARMFMAAVLNHISTIAYHSSVFQRSEIGALYAGFHGLLDSIYKDLLVRLGRYSEVSAPAPHDMAAGTTFELFA